MVKNLLSTADKYDEDYKLQAWIEIDKLINNNVADFLEVVSPDELIDILDAIKNGVSKINASNPEISELIEQLETSTSETIKRIETAKE